ncbi:MAG: aspartate carbamoyltransferase, partial [Janthinobacterium lividum]
MTIPQQTFLRDAMRRLNMTRDAFANRIGVTRRALDTWLLPEESQESRTMPEIVERFVQEIMARQSGSESGSDSINTQSVHYASSSYVGSIQFEGRPQLLSVDQFSRDSVEDLFRVADMMQPIARRQKIS